VTDNLVDIIWGSDRPSRSEQNIKPLDIKYTGKASDEKIEDLRKELDKKKGAGLVLCMSPESLRWRTVRANVYT